MVDEPAPAARCCFGVTVSPPGAAPSCRGDADRELAPAQRHSV